MEPLPVITALRPRGMDEIAAAAQAVQANVVALRVAFSKRSGQAGDLHDIKTPAPGPVTRMREMLIDREVIKNYGDAEVVLRLRQVWGEFCALCWLFPFVDPQTPINFAKLSPTQGLRCLGDIHSKLSDVQIGLWRIVLEESMRADPDTMVDLLTLQRREGALTKPLKVAGKTVRAASAEELLSCACEYAGMLAALRWVMDDRWAWEAPGIMEVALHHLP